METCNDENANQHLTHAKHLPHQMGGGPRRERGRGGDVCGLEMSGRGRGAPHLEGEWVFWPGGEGVGCPSLEMSARGRGAPDLEGEEVSWPGGEGGGVTAPLSVARLKEVCPDWKQTVAVKGEFFFW